MSTHSTTQHSKLVKKFTDSRVNMTSHA